MRFNLIRQEVIKQHNKRMPKIETQEDLDKELSFYGRSYKGNFETQRKKFLSFIERRIEKDKKRDEDFIKSVEENKGLPNPLIITVEWKDSRTWGKNPRAFTNYGFIGESIGGCGYCKLSTATAQALNSNLYILNLLFRKEERRLKENLFKEKKNKVFESQENKPRDRRNYIGYGSGYYALPRFEGGVGVESHRNIIEGLNLQWEYITNTSQTDVFRIAI